jgi:hypothetical protein
MKTKCKSMIAALALLVTSGAGAEYARPGLVLGDWRMNSDLGLGFTINAETAWNYSNRGRSDCSKLTGSSPRPGEAECYKLSLYVNCKANQFNLSVVTVCKTCLNKDVDLDVSIDGVRRFALKGVDEVTGPRRRDDLGGSLVRAPLTPEQVAALSKTRASIWVELSDRAPIYVEPNGTELAFATLTTACAKE